MAANDFQQRLAAIQEQFRSGLLQTHQELQAQIDELRLTPSPSGWQKLHAKLHTLVGTSGTLGFKELSQEARAVEQLLRAQSNDSGDSQWQTCQGPLHQLLALIARECQQTLPLSAARQELVSANRPAPTQAMPAFGWQQHQFEIYLLDDQDHQFEALSEQLQQFGYDILAFTSHDFANLNRSEPGRRIVLLATGRSRQQQQHIFQLGHQLCQQHQVILFTEDDCFRLRLQAVNHGFKGFFSLPADINEVLARLRKFEQVAEQRNYRVLLIDDDPNLTRFLSEALSHYGFITDSLNQPALILEKLQQFEPDLFLLDYNMPEVNGSELAAIIRQLHSYSLTPIVLLTADAELIKTEMIALGSDDVLPKDLAPALLAKQLLSRLQRAEQIRSLMQLDGLTQLLNHDNIQLAAHQVFSLSQRSQQDCSLVFIDLDHFKQVNDRHGHLIGDQVLIGLARLLKQRLRVSDLVGRFGGEEFLLVLPQTSPINAKLLLDRLLEAFQELEFRSPTEPFFCSFSAGISSNQNANLIQALKDADQALYQAKANGRANVVIAAAH